MHKLTLWKCYGFTNTEQM